MRVYVITGGTRGIGAAVARKLAAREKTALVLAYRENEERARDLADELDRPESPVVAIRADVADDEQTRKLFDRAGELGELNGLVNSAGVLERQSDFSGIDSARWERILRTNVIGLATCCREAVRRMRDSDLPDRVIVNLSSRAAVLGAAHEYVDYAASKAAVDALTRGLALEVAETGIRVNAVRPGIIDTEIHADGGEPGRAQRLGPQVPLGRAGTAEDVAGAVAWLLSGEAAFVTGTVLDVSGGR